MKMQPNRLGITAIAPLVLGVAQCRSHTQAPTVSHGGRGPRDFAEMQTATKQPRHLTLNEFAMIPAGRFKMGSMMPPEDLGEDFPLHDVAVNKVYIAKHEVTKALWDKISFWGTSHGYTDLPSGEGRAADHPVQLVSCRSVLKDPSARHRSLAMEAKCPPRRYFRKPQSITRRTSVCLLYTSDAADE